MPGKPQNVVGWEICNQQQNRKIIYLEIYANGSYGVLYGLELDVYIHSLTGYSPS